MSEPVEPSDGADGAAPRANSGPEAPRPVVDHTVCLCAGLGPLLTQTLRTLTVPEEVKRTVHETEREGLRLLKMFIDLRLSSLGGPGAAPAEADRGTKLDVE
jgi:hypothetical protein